MQGMKCNVREEKTVEERKEPKLVHRVIPCPQYDVSGMECWLADMAEQGLFLQEDGFFCGIATFEQGKPGKRKYRLQAAGKSTSMWADNGGNPDEEEIELNGEFGWKYVAKRGEFYVYFTDDPDARELHTDKEVQALAMNAMKKRQRDSIFNSVFFGIVNPYILLRGKILLTMIHMGTVPIVLIMLVALWMSIHSVVQAVKLISLRKKVLQEEVLGSGDDWKKGVRSYHANNLLRRCACVIAIAFLIKTLGNYMIYENYMPLAEYAGEVPFKTMVEFVPGGKMERMNMKVGNMNTVREWSDILSAINYEWDEAGTVTGADGTILSGGLEVIYHETKAEWIARRLVTEYLRKGKQEKEYEPLKFEMDELDEVVAYTTSLHFPCVILRNGNKILYARFYTTGGESVKLTLEEWAGFLAEGLDK